MYTLIIVMLIYGGPAGGPASPWVEHVPSFTSLASCKAAAGGVTFAASIAAIKTQVSTYCAAQ